MTSEINSRNARPHPHSGLVADIKFFGRHTGGSIRDGVILSVTDASAYEQRAPR